VFQVLPSIGCDGPRILVPQAFEPPAMPELDACGLRRRGGSLTCAAIGKDRVNDPSRASFKMSLWIGRQDPIELDGDGTEVGAARVVTDLAVDVGVEGSVP
jgi:hypothetical protein